MMGCTEQFVMTTGMNWMPQSFAHSSDMIEEVRSQMHYHRGVKNLSLTVFFVKISLMKIASLF